MFFFDDVYANWVIVVLQTRQIRETGTIQCHDVIQSLERLLEIRSVYSAHPVFSIDLFHLSVITKHYVTYCLTSSALRQDFTYLWSITDLLFNYSTVFQNARSFSRHVCFVFTMYGF